MNAAQLPTQACRHCGRKIAWVRTVAGKPMPLDPDPHDKGNVLVRFVAGVLSASVLLRSEMDGTTERPNGIAYMPHFATCPSWPGNPKGPAKSSAPSAPKPTPEPPPSLF